MGAPLTNRLGLPEPIVQACENDDYSRGEGVWRSVTQLTGPPRIAVLLERFPEQRTVEDVSDCAWKLQGKAIHKILEEANTDGLAEKRLYMAVGDVWVSGQFDHMTLSEDATLTDYKTVSVWSLAVPRFRQPKVLEWTQQLNLYSYMLGSVKGIFAKKLQVAIPVIDGWSRAEAKRNRDYPQAKMALVAIDLWTAERTWDFLNERIRLHKEAEENLPLCSEEERWQEPAKYAVMKKGRKSAIRVFEEYFAAVAHEGYLGGKPPYYVEERPSVPKRCVDSCPMRDFCPTLNDGQWLSTDLNAEDDNGGD